MNCHRCILRQSTISENMHLTLPLLLVGLFISSSAFSRETKLWRRFDGLPATGVVGITAGDRGGVEKDIRDDEAMEDPDFEDDYPEELNNLFGPSDQSVHSVTHLHRDGGEVLVPCFGMWWPVGGPTYDYGGDYYGDYKRKRRRSRKQKKTSRMKKKKS